MVKASHDPLRQQKVKVGTYNISQQQPYIYASLLYVIFYIIS